MAILKEQFGKTQEGSNVDIFTLENKNGMKAKITSYGAILTHLYVPNKEGSIDDIVLGFDKLEDYFNNPNFFGTTIGRSANRIAGAKFEIDGVEYMLDKNEGENNLHTHFSDGFHKKVWTAQADEKNNAVKFSLYSPDGETGFPGNLNVSVTYVLTDENALELHYEGKTDKKTLINLTNHTYFNLKGHDGSNIHDEKLWINASYYTPVAAGAIPTGEIASVTGTAFDFRKDKTIGQDIDADDKQLIMEQGYDHNYVLDTTFGKVELMARVSDEAAGRVMEVYTDLPGVQLYTGNCIDKQSGKNGAAYDKRLALCLETQYFPNSINEENFKKPIFSPENPYQTTTIYKFL